MVAGPDPSLLTQPSRAIKRALEPIDMTVADVDLFELNEAFAAVGLASMRDLGITDDIVNVNGGAIALGHPVGMSGTRVVLTLDQRAAPPRRRRRRGRAVRRRRPGRRRDRPHAVAHALRLSRPAYFSDAPYWFGPGGPSVAQNTISTMMPTIGISDQQPPAALVGVVQPADATASPGMSTARL